MPFPWGPSSLLGLGSALGICRFLGSPAPALPILGRFCVEAGPWEGRARAVGHCYVPSTALGTEQVLSECQVP